MPQNFGDCAARRRVKETEVYIHRGPLKKGATFIFTITLANVDRFQ